MSTPHLRPRPQRADVCLFPDSGGIADIPQPLLRAITGLGRCKEGASLFDHFVGQLLELHWYIEAECRGGLEVDHQFEPLWPLYRQVTWLVTVQDFRDVITASSEHLAYVRPVSNETAGFWKLSEQGNKGEPFGMSQ